MNPLLTAIVFAAFAIYVYFISRSTYLGWLSILAVQLYEFSFGIRAAVLGGIHLDPVDIVSFGLLIAGVIRTLPRLRERNTARIIGFGFLAIFAASLIRGIIANGFLTAANEARGFVPILAAILYFLSTPADSSSLRKYVISYFCYGVGFVVVALFAYAGARVGGVAWLHSAEQISDTIENRLLPAAAALGIATCFIFSLSWSSQKEPRKFSFWLPAVFLGTAIFLRHRSVWSALLVGAVSLLLTDRRLFRRLMPMAAASLLVIAVFATVASFTSLEGGGAQGAVEDTQEEFAYSASDSGTWQWRVEVWTSYVFGQDQTLTTILFGHGLGEGYYSLNPSAGYWISAPPHSEYVADYSRVGLIGVGFLFWFLLRPLVRFWSLAKDEALAIDPTASTWIAGLLGAMVYGVTYSIPLDVFALVGIACAVLARFDADIIIPAEELMPSQSSA